ncbi:(p)ppGpp synthetase [Tissierella carlieri]|uniref:(P)ppGpp synthetase n=1 Tax=Tissierella carlieri TaxID=689904 RepID=A0ABT1SCT9_9FIRM|nr:(p)ppGpp synthetase [Tissierella carlieri]MBU5310577.1 (p)ppGpp synthetase [Tissierella carlieri]MCQ4924254.1 (p)ppGpp synthetase [Tissierella carlieri]
MKLELFDFIDETLALIEERKESIENVANSLEKFFTDSFFIKDHFLNVNYRIKSPESLREKILRHNFYIKYKTPENLLNNLSDLIGFRIECRFIEDENKIYKDIMKLFDIKCENGFYTNPLNSNIMLQLDEKQPQKQKNGFEIYKIDGKYCKDGTCINFELQIKSLVNVFWGEIDHRILYKNFNYMLTEDFFRDIMSSIKDNLSMIDRQLMLVYNHLNGMDASNSLTKKVQLQALLSKIIHDIYIVKIRQEIGFVVDFKKSTDVIVNYIFMKGGPEESENYSVNFLRILNRLNDIGKNDISFNRYINFEREIFFNDDFTRKIGSSILEIINKDFRWNLFFRIIFEIEEGNNAEDFEGFMIFIRYRFHENLMMILENKNIEESQKEQIVTCVLETIATTFSKEVDVDFLSDCSIKSLNNNIGKLFTDIHSFDDWIERKEGILDVILNHDF